MAFQLANYNYNGLAVAAPYLKVTGTSLIKSTVQSGAVMVSWTLAVYASATAYSSGSAPLETRQVTIDSITNADLFASYLNAAPTAPASGTPDATTLLDIILQQAYIILPHVPSVATLLTGATGV